VDVTSLGSGVTALAVGSAHTCVITTGGGMKCWGVNANGRLGDGTTANRTAPVDVIGLSSGVTAIAAGGMHTCALVNGGAKCWGFNAYGQLGTGTYTDALMPVSVSGLSSAVSDLTAGQAHTCALVGNGRPKCWGSDDWGQLGQAIMTGSLTPVDAIASLPPPSILVNYEGGKPGSFFTITGLNFAPNAPLSPIVTDTLKGSVAHMRPPVGSVRNANEPAKPHWIVFPRFQSGAPTTLSPHAKARAFMQLADNAFNYNVHGKRGFETVADLIDTSGCYEFSYGNLDEAVAVFDTLAKSAP
jgi:hypothetical protein